MTSTIIRCDPPSLSPAPLLRPRCLLRYLPPSQPPTPRLTRLLLRAATALLSLPPLLHLLLSGLGSAAAILLLYSLTSSLSSSPVAALLLALPLSLALLACLALCFTQARRQPQPSAAKVTVVASSPPSAPSGDATAAVSVYGSGGGIRPTGAPHRALAPDVYRDSSLDL